jgi:hypothetical protein
MRSPPLIYSSSSWMRLWYSTSSSCMLFWNSTLWVCSSFLHWDSSCRNYWVRFY